jgi:virulence-associated protein VapD
MVSVYTYYIDKPWAASFNERMKTGTRLSPVYGQLQRQLIQLGWISQGTVLERAPGQQGSRYVWTRKVRAKTVTVALSEEQYHWLKQAVANQRKLEEIIQQMQKLSHQILFEKVPGVVRRKRLSKKVGYSGNFVATAAAAFN